MDILDELRAAMENRVDDWSDDDRATAVEVAKDLAAMNAKLVAGQDVSLEELGLARAAARNLAAAATVTGATILMEFLERVTGKALALLNPLA